MRKFVIVALAGVFGLAGAAETVQPAAAADSQPTARSVAEVRHNALQAMYGGELQPVQSMSDRSWQRGRGYRGNRKWRGRHWRGGRSYYGRRHYRGRGYYGRRYYGPRRYHHRRYRGPGIYFGIR